MLKMLQSIHKNVKACVQTTVGITNEFTCKYGLRQGCILSPLLFFLFINDLKSEIDSVCPLITLNDCDFRILLFADDLILLAETHGNLQKLLNCLNIYYKKWSLKVNVGKSNIMFFRIGGYLRKREKWTFDKEHLLVANRYKYLGVDMTPKGLWSLCQQVRSQQANKVIFMIKSSISHFYDLSPSTLLKLFDSKVLPILHYGCEIWGFHEAKFGRVNLKTLRLTNIVKFWLKLLCMNDNRIAKKAYIVQYNWAENNTSCWALNVKNLLFSYGFGEAWYSQCW